MSTFMMAQVPSKCEYVLVTPDDNHANHEFRCV